MTTPQTDHQHFQTAVRTLLARPLLTTAGGDAAAVALVHSHKDDLREWFDRNLGWQLTIDRDVVRLYKVPEQEQGFEGDAPTQRRCVLYCLVLAAIEDCGEQTVITELAERVSVLAATRDDIENYDAGQFRDRQDLVAVLRMLVDQGVLIPTRDASTTDRDEQSYVQAEGNALYDINRRAAAVILGSPTAPSRAGVPARLTEQAIPDTPEAQNRRRHFTVMRRLVDTPVLYFDDLPEDKAGYFHSQRYLLVREIIDGLGARIEVRKEGAAVIDDELTDLPFPKERTSQFAALAFAEALTREPDVLARDAIVPETRVDAITEEVTARVAAVAKTISNRPITEAGVKSVGLGILTMLQLVEQTERGIRVLPALGRFRSPIMRTSHRDEEELSLFEIESQPGAGDSR